MMRRCSLVVALLAILASAAVAQVGGGLGGVSLRLGTPSLPTVPGAGHVTVDGHSAAVTLEAGGLSLDLTLTFEQVVGLSAANLGISARLVSPAELAGRFPDGASPGGGLPLLVSVEPPPSGGLSFSGVALVEVHTHDLSFTTGSPLRLYKADGGGPFADITEFMGTGSYRARGSSGGFSEFLIVADGRSAAAAVEDKLDRLDGLLAADLAAIPSGLRGTLQSQVGAIRLAWNAGNVTGAITATNLFADTVKLASGSAIPDVWRSARDLNNVGGDLRAAAATLRFGLALAD
ncbi:MAG TPA: DUF6689 family protein [Thermoanaerobaculia bacterium]|jgi:hypothetical protein|nr:DUF6689 family protein [Thermoanaerobaculia bacterium]